MLRIPSGCSKRLSSKAAASKEARRTLRYVEPLSDARTPLADFFSIPGGGSGMRSANVTEPMRILALGAHPDDIEVRCGRTLIKYPETGHRIFLMVMTKGGAGANVSV